MIYDDNFEHREDKQYQEPRVKRQRGQQLELEYLDGFGRLTKRVSCKVELLYYGGKSFDAQCQPGSEIVLEWNLYGTDGLIRAYARPYKPTQEAPAFTVIPFRDPAGREFIMQSPAHVDLASEDADWLTSYDWYATGRNIHQDASGRTQIESVTTLKRETSVEGDIINRREFDAYGRLIRSQDKAERLNYRYNARHLVTGIERDELAPVVLFTNLSRSTVY